MKKYSKKGFDKNVCFWKPWNSKFSKRKLCSFCKPPQFGEKVLKDIFWQMWKLFKILKFKDLKRKILLVLWARLTFVDKSVNFSQHWTSKNLKRQRIWSTWNWSLHKFLRENMQAGISNMEDIHELIIWNDTYAFCVHMTTVLIEKTSLFGCVQRLEVHAFGQKLCENVTKSYLQFR